LIAAAVAIKLDNVVQFGFAQMVFGKLLLQIAVGPVIR
jgi:hypothetical protein